MKKHLLVLLAVSLGVAQADDGNPEIDFEGFKKLVVERQAIREKKRISEDEFLRMAREKGTIILDSRSKAKFDKLHVKGAVHLNFSDFTEASLAKLIPDRSTRILIYCNNNFAGEPTNFPSKRRPVALNIPTYLNLLAYGFENVYELKPLLNIKTTKIQFEGTTVKSLKKAARASLRQ